jgi:hypothetical protein
VLLQQLHLKPTPNQHPFPCCAGCAAWPWALLWAQGLELVAPTFMSNGCRPQKCRSCQVTAVADACSRFGSRLYSLAKALCLSQLAPAKMTHHSLGTTQL